MFYFRERSKNSKSFWALKSWQGLDAKISQREYIRLCSSPFGQLWVIRTTMHPLHPKIITVMTNWGLVGDSYLLSSQLGQTNYMQSALFIDTKCQSCTRSNGTCAWNCHHASGDKRLQTAINRSPTEGIVDMNTWESLWLTMYEIMNNGSCIFTPVPVYCNHLDSCNPIWIKFDRLIGVRVRTIAIFLVWSAWWWRCTSHFLNFYNILTLES